MNFALRLFFLIAFAAPLPAQTLGHGQAWRFQLLDGAAIMDDCTECDRPIFWESLKGSFDLEGTPTPQLYRISNIDFASDLTGAPNYRVSGDGSLSFETGEPVVTLNVVVARNGESETAAMTNVMAEAPRVFPMLALEATAPPAPFHFYRLRIHAAPIRELWFSTGIGFTRGTPGIPEEAAISDGDLLSNTGRVVKRNAELTALLAIPPGDIGLDAADIGPRGEFFFSTTASIESGVIGPIHHGDLVTSAGRLYLQNAQLLSAFGVEDAEAGLDALQIVSDDEFYFSISKMVSRSGGGSLRSGDILSNKGRIVRSEAALLVRFVSPLADGIGVDAFYSWPNGEIWFSTEGGFASSLGPIAPGDILSDQGYIVMRNLDLMAPFAPIERIADFGFDAMTVISDAAAKTASTQILEINLAEGIEVRWESAARVFQLERATAVEGPYEAVTPIILERRAGDPFSSSAAFYRVRQW